MTDQPYRLQLLLHRPVRTLASLVFCTVLPAQAAELEIEVRGIKVRTGQMHAALFASAEDFSLDGLPRRDHPGG